MNYLSFLQNKMKIFKTFYLLSKFHCLFTFTNHMVSEGLIS
ncbi:hypothetical protein C1O63_0750 [Dehalococcoides mccartyi]|nr:hypothetical protein C1O63_0750 [Dehalococcoides mccartyi]